MSGDHRTVIKGINLLNFEWINFIHAFTYKT
jgi:hypothetical protein